MVSLVLPPDAQSKQRRVKTQLMLWRTARCVRPTKEARLIPLSSHFLLPMFAWEEPHKYLSLFLAAPLTRFKLWQKRQRRRLLFHVSAWCWNIIFCKSCNHSHTSQGFPSSCHPLSTFMHHSGSFFPSYTPTSTPFLLLLSCANTTCIIPSFSIIWPNACTTKISLQI